MKIETKYDIGDLVSPVVGDVEMLIDTIQLGAGIRYHCHWFVDGQLKDSWFGEIEIEPVSDKKVGFNNNG